MAIVDCYTSTFADNGENMSLKPIALEEMEKTRNMAPKWVMKLKWLFVAHYRLRRLLAGHFNMKPTYYAVYTIKSPDRRVVFDVPKPTTIWWNRL